MTWLVGDAGRADWHTHSDRTDGTASAAAMADAAVRAGLTGWGLSDHVRAATTWLPEYVEATRALRREGLEIRCGVEAKLLDRSGRLDLPSLLPELDFVLLADHQFPGRHGPLHPQAVKDAITRGSMSTADVVGDLVEATVAGLRRSPYPPIVAHLFSLLPKMGLSESDVGAEHLGALASVCNEVAGAVEVNEKWRCPSSAAIAFLAGAGVGITSGSDAHHVDEVGRHDYFESIRTEPSARVSPDDESLSAVAG